MDLTNRWRDTCYSTFNLAHHEIDDWRHPKTLWLVKLVERTGPLYSYVREQVTPVG